MYEDLKIACAIPFKVSGHRRPTSPDRFRERQQERRGRLREAEEEARVSGELSSKCVMSDVAFLSMRVKCVGVVYAR